MKRALITLSLLTILLTGCKKDNSETVLKPISEPDYLQLEIGNYWVYEWYHLDQDGNESFDGTIDSCIIIGDTSINGYQYFKQHYTYLPHTVYLRDSSGYLIDLRGKVLFSTHDFTNIIREDTIGPGLAIATYMMTDNDTAITVPYGTYSVIDFKGTISALDPQSSHGTQYVHYFYADGLGMIKSSVYYYSAPSLRTGKRLTNFGNIEIGVQSSLTW